MNRNAHKRFHTHTHGLLPTLTHDIMGLHSECFTDIRMAMRVITVESCKRSDVCYHPRVISFVTEGSSLGVSDLSKAPPSPYRHQPPNEVIRVRVFILGAQLWGVELSCPQDLQYPIQGLCHGHRAAFLRCIDDVDHLDDEIRIFFVDTLRKPG